MARRDGLVAGEKFSVDDWCILVCALFRLEQSYRLDGKDGLRAWNRLKIMLFIYMVNTPVRVGALETELGLEKETIAKEVKHLFESKKYILPIGYAQGVNPNASLPDTIIELSLEGRKFVMSIISSYKEEIEKIRGLRNGWEANYYG